MGAERLDEDVDAVAPDQPAVLGRVRDQMRQRGIRVGDHALQQAVQHRVLGREVEVERRSGDTGTLGQVVDRDLGERTLLEQAFGRLQDRQLAVVAGGARSACRATGGPVLPWSHRRLYTLSIPSTGC